MMGLSEDLVLLGKVSGTHGIRGELRVTCYSGEYDTLMGLKTLLLRGPKGDLLEVGVASAKVHGGRGVVKLQQFESINDVEHLVGRELVIHRSQLPPLDSDTYYWHDLIGLRVHTDDGADLGTLVEILETGGSDIYVVKSGIREYLIPAVEDIVTAIDLAAGVMTVNPPEGLLDL